MDTISFAMIEVMANLRKRIAIALRIALSEGAEDSTVLAKDNGRKILAQNTHNRL